MKKNVRITCFAIVCTLALIAALPTAAQSKFDGNWNTHLACDAHGETPAYAWDFPSTIKDGAYTGQHAAPGEPGYLVITGKIGADGNAKLDAKGTVTVNHAHGVFAMKGNNYSYVIKASFTESKGSGTRDEGAGILGRPCTFDFTRQPDGAAVPATPPAGPPPAQ